MIVTNKWPVVRLSTLAVDTKGAIAGGPFGSDLVSRDYVASGVPVIRGGNLSNHTKFSFDDLVFVTENKADAHHLNCAHPGDLVFTQRGTLGQIGLLPKESPYPRFLISQSQMKMTVDANRADAIYLYNYFQLPSTVAYIENHALQSGVPHINLGILKKLQIICPPLNIQKKIAAIITSYDELIENNQRRIALLEKIAEEIYREWFVRLRFPGYEKARFIKGVPEGWKRTRVVTLTSYLKRGVAPQYDDLAEGLAINQKCIRDGKLDLNYARRQSRDVPVDRQARFGDVLVNSTGEGTLGRVAQVLVPISNCIVDSHVTIVRPKPDVPIHYFGMTLKAWEMHFITMGRGATNQTELAPSVIGGVEVTVPSKPLQDTFESHAEPLFAQITHLTDQNARLVRTRDLLLPRLISGKLSVENLDIQFPPGMEDHP